MGHGQKGYGLGALFRSVAQTVMPLVKRGAKALGNIALNTGANFASAILAGKNAKQAAKARALEGVNAAKTKAVQRLVRYAQTGQGRKRSRSSTKKRHPHRQAGAPLGREKRHQPNAKLKRERHPYR